MSVEAPRPDRFGKDFRERRFHHAVVQRANLEGMRYDPNRTEAEMSEALRVAQWGVWSLFMDIERRGDFEELNKAFETLSILREATKGGQIFPSEKMGFPGPDLVDGDGLPF